MQVLLSVKMLYQPYGPLSDGIRRTHVYAGIAQYALRRPHLSAVAYIAHHIHIHRAISIAGIALCTLLTCGSFLDEGIPRGYLHDKRYGAGYLAKGPLLAKDISHRKRGDIIESVPNEKEQQLMVFMLGDELTGGIVNMLRDIVVTGLDHQERHGERDEEDRVTYPLILRGNGLVLPNRQPFQ